MLVKIPVSKLESNPIFNPFIYQPWSGLGRVPYRISRKRVEMAINDGRLIDHVGSNDNAGRIAWFVLNESNDPIDIAVGFPKLGHREVRPVQDGCHRLAAAIYAGQKFIWASVSGDFDYARRLLGVAV